MRTAVWQAARIFGWLPLVVSFGFLAGVGPERVMPLALMPLLIGLPFPALSLGPWRLAPWLTGLYGLWGLSWSVGAGVEFYLASRYQLLPQSREVIEALIHAPENEVREMAASLVVPLAAGGLAAFGMALWLAASLARMTALAARLRLPRVYALPARALMLVLPLALHGNIVVERADPIAFWPSILREGLALKREEAALDEWRHAANAHVGAWQPVYVGPKVKTVVLVIGESSNRWDWSLYGYPRKTTPGLDALRPELVVFRDAISSYGNTIVELTRALTPAHVGDDEAWRTAPGVPALAKAAGYKLFWLTNQSTAYTNILFGGEADVFQLVYRGRVGRHDRSLDGQLLPPFEAALADPAPRKLIVLHCLGSHEDYALRYPPEFDVFGHRPDAVSDSLSARWWWVRQARDAYDNSILYTDHLLVSAINSLKRVKGDATLFYFSDHGQDVGHLTASHGHQFWLESGFTVPMILWRNRPGFPDAYERGLESRPYQTDELDWTLLSLLGISTLHDQPQHDLLGPAFVPWQRTIKGKAYVPGLSHRVPEGETAS